VIDLTLGGPNSQPQKPWLRVVSFEGRLFGDLHVLMKQMLGFWLAALAFALIYVEAAGHCAS